MAGDKQRKRDDGRRQDKQRRSASQDVRARKSGNPEARPKARGNVPRAMKSGRQASK